MSMLCLVVALSGCSSGSISRPEAARMIGEHPFWTDTSRVTIRTSPMQCQRGQPSYDMKAVAIGLVDFTIRELSSQEQAFKRGPNYEVCRKQLESLYSVPDFQLLAQVINGTVKFYVWEAKLTPKAVAIGVPATGGEIVIQRHAFSEVTGLAKNSDGTVTAEFSWIMENTAAGKTLNLPEPNHNGTATLKHYDDGWRLVEFKS